MLKTTVISLCSLYQLSSAGPSRMLFQVPGSGTTTTIPAIPEILPIVPETTTTTLAAAATTAAQTTTVPPVTTAAATTTAVPVVQTTTTAAATTTTAVPVVQTTTTTTAVPIVQTTTTTAVPVVQTTTTTVAPATTTVAPGTTTTIVAPATTTSTTVPPAVLTTVAAPDGYQYGAYGQFCELPAAGTRDTRCMATSELFSDLDTGNVDCSLRSDCCLCSSVECGFGAKPCDLMVFGASSVFGVKDIKVQGNEATNRLGAVIECGATDACRESVLEGKYVYEIECGAADACRDAVFRITDPKEGFSIDCGASSCFGLTLEILYSGPPAGMQCNPAPEVANRISRIGSIECNGNAACEGLDVTINNQGCHKVKVQKIDCLQPHACDGAVFNLIGQVEIQNCQCGPSCDNAMGLEKCFTGLENLVCPDPRSCENANKIITNPANEFEMTCGNVQSCESAQFTFELTPDPVAPAGLWWKGFKFGGQNSARGATFTIENGLAEDLRIELIECGGWQSCSGMTFITGPNVVIDLFKCNDNACYGCTIKETAASVGVPCDVTQTQAPETIQTLLPVQTTTTTTVAPGAATTTNAPATTTVAPGTSNPPIFLPIV